MRILLYLWRKRLVMVKVNKNLWNVKIPKFTICISYSGYCSWLIVCIPQLPAKTTLPDRNLPLPVIGHITLPGAVFTQYSATLPRWNPPFPALTLLKSAFTCTTPPKHAKPYILRHYNITSALVTYWDWKGMYQLGITLETFLKYFHKKNNKTWNFEQKPMKTLEFWEWGASEMFGKKYSSMLRIFDLESCYIQYP
jgi:hypothetical protein